MVHFLQDESWYESAQLSNRNEGDESTTKIIPELLLDPLQ